MLFGSDYKKRCYEGIDFLPVFNWWRVHESNDVTWILKKKKLLSEKNTKKVEKIWREIYAEFIDRFGFSESFAEIIQKKKAIALLQIDKVLTGDKSIQTLINIEQIQLDKMLGDNIKSDFLSIKTSIERSLRFHLDMQKVSVAEFYSYIQVIKTSSRRKPKDSFEED